VKVSWDEDIPIYEMEQTTFSKPPTRVPILLSVLKLIVSPILREATHMFRCGNYVYQISPNAIESSWAANIKNKVLGGSSHLVSGL
jgi:hypothetical protein